MADQRKKNGAATRETILRAARLKFAAESYEAVGMRDVAREAGVDAALVNRYFGSKEELFRKVLLERAGDEWFGGATNAAELEQWLSKLALGDGGDIQADLERLYIILRSASSVPAAAAIKTSFTEDVFTPLCDLLKGPDAQARASLALSLVIGLTVLRGIMGSEDAPAGRQTDTSDKIRSTLGHILGSDAPSD